jgi:D-alanyl-D-alanine carboxypeptidase
MMRAGKAVKKYVVVACVILFGAGLWFAGARPGGEKRLNKAEAQARIEEYFRKTVRKDRGLRNAYLLVHSDRLGIHLNLAEGRTGEIPADPGQPYYIASVGKMFTAVLCGILAEKGLLSYDDPVSRYLDPELMAGLHVFKGRDYSGDIKVRHLLNHSSGLPDYFEEKPEQGRPMLDAILSEPDRLMAPPEVVQWSKDT